MSTTTTLRWMDLVDGIEERADRIGAATDARTEELYRERRLPADLYHSVAVAGLFRQLVPIDLGGLGRTPLEWFRTGMALARHEASLGWVVTQGAAELGWIASGADEQWALEVLGEPHAASASSIAGLGTLTVQGDRSRIAGRWAFNTGCHGATWIGGMTLVRDGSDRNGELQLRFGWVPAERAQIVDTWDPSGLHGTGSDTTVIDDVDIPTSWTFDLFSPTTNERGPYRVVVGNGNWPIATAVAATQLGNARRALDESAELVMTKAPMPDLTPLAASSAVQRAIAELEGSWLGARASLEEELESMWEAATATGELSTDQRVRLHRANVIASRCAVEVVDRLCEITGTASVSRTHVLARCLRDALALRGHVSVGGAAAEHNTKVALGIEPPHRLV